MSKKRLAHNRAVRPLGATIPPHVVYGPLNAANAIYSGSLAPWAGTPRGRWWAASYWAHDTTAALYRRAHSMKMSRSDPRRTA